MKIRNILPAAALLATASAALPPTAVAQPASAASAAAPPSSPAKKALVQRVITLQQGTIEAMSRSVVERPVAQITQRAGIVLQTQVAPERREAAARSMEADIRQFLEEARPVLRDRALQLAPSTYGAFLEEKFSEDELRQLVAWLESPVNAKLQQVAPDMQSAFMQRLGTEANGLLGGKLQTLERKLNAALGAPAGAASQPASAPTKPKPKATR